MNKNNALNNRKTQLILFFVVGVLFFICISSFDPYITPYATQLGIPVSKIGVILSIAGATSIIVRFPIGIFAEMFRRRKILVQLGLLLTVVCWLLAFWFPSIATLSMGKVADGVTGGTWVLYTVLFASYFKDEEIPKAMAMIQLASTVGPFIGMNIGGTCSKLMGYEYSFIVAVIAAVIGLLLLMFIREPEVVSGVSMKTAWSYGREQLLDRDVWILGLFASVAMMTTYAGRDLLTPLMAGDLGGDAVALTILPNLFMIFNTIATALSGVFSQKFGLVRTVAAGALGQGVVAAAMPFSPNLMTLYVLQAAGGFFFGMTATVVLALIIMGVRPEVQTSRMGLYQSIYSVGLTIGPMISGFILEETNLRITYFVMAVAVILIGLLSKKLLPIHLLQKKTHEESDIAKTMD